MSKMQNFKYFLFVLLPLLSVSQSFFMFIVLKTKTKQQFGKITFFWVMFGYKFDAEYVMLL